jgi:hypothetical protein
LRTGGYVIYMRHMTADVGRDVPGAGEWWKKCGEGHRMLSDKGRAEAVHIGEAIRRCRFPISEVRSSEYCRTIKPRAFLPRAPRADARLNGWPAWKAVDPERGLKPRLAQGTRELLAAAQIGNGACLAQAGLPSADLLADLKDGDLPCLLQMAGAGSCSARIRVEDRRR